ncbi:MAG: phytanoyl-CoA dioxygenase family protein [bacterium]|nr:phytanoyl-CoA dioxygenase family protein [bacterium]
MTAEEQRAFFEDQGYLVLEDFMTAAEVDTCETEIDHLHRFAASLAAEDPRRLDFQLEPYVDAAAQDGHDLPLLRKIEQTRDYSDIFCDLAAHPKLIDTVRLLLGDDLLLFRSTLMLKPALHGSVHALHQDSAYWPMDPPSLVTVSIALNDSAADNGCIQVIPGSHKWGMRDWGLIAQDKDKPLTQRDDLDLSRLTPMPLTAGSALLFHSLVVHGSGPNNSPRPRHTALYAYFPPTVHYRPKPGAAREKTVPVIHGLGGRSTLTLAADA